MSKNVPPPLPLRRAAPAPVRLAAPSAAGGLQPAEAGRGQECRRPPRRSHHDRAAAARPFNDALQALGTAQARESVTITAKVSDVVTRLAFDSGQRVRAGQLLADMNSRAQQADVAAAEAALRDAEQQLRRGGELAKAQLIARGQYDTLRANRDAAAASVQAKRASVADRTITAPFAGVLGLRQVSLGALVAPGTVITTLDDDSTIKLDFTLPEAALSSIAQRTGDHRDQRCMAGRDVRRPHRRHRQPRRSGNARGARARRTSEFRRPPAPGHAAARAGAAADAPGAGAAGTGGAAGSRAELGVPRRRRRQGRAGAGQARHAPRRRGRSRVVV